MSEIEIPSISFFEAGDKVSFLKPKTIYIIGPMLGIPQFNFPAFDKAKKEWESEGWRVVSPADLDRNVGFDGCLYHSNTDWSRPPEDFDMEACIRRDVEAILDLRKGVDAVFVLPGKRGAGSEAELRLALWRKLDIYFSAECSCAETGLFETDEKIVEQKPKPGEAEKPANDINPEMAGAADLLDETKRLVCSDRNKDYGTPDKDFARTADMWTGYLRDILMGPLKSSDVAWMMMMVKASRSRHNDKRDNYVDAAGYAACGWKCMEKYLEK